MSKISYKQSGVDIEKGERLVDWLKQTSSDMTMPHQQRLVQGVGGFAALFDGRFPNMEKPCLVSATDGVGTKLKLASYFEDYSTIGQDLVAMCVNDLICTGGRPLFFLDYFAVGKLDLEMAKSFLTGVRLACNESDCVLIGGETAEMPGTYHGNDFDCAGFAVGVVDEKHAYSAARVKAGYKLIGVESSGFHSNGFSLLRKIFAEDLSDWKQELLQPTQLYVKLALHLQKSMLNVVSMAHITGGGLDNLLRVLPRGFKAQLKPWTIPNSFKEVKKRSQLTSMEMLKTLNCGLGLVIVVADENYSEIMDQIAILNEYKAFDLGEIVKSTEDRPPSWEFDDEPQF